MVDQAKETPEPAGASSEEEEELDHDLARKKVMGRGCRGKGGRGLPPRWAAQSTSWPNQATGEGGDEKGR